MKKNTEKAIERAFVEMIQADLPIAEFAGRVEDTDDYVFNFSRPLSADEQTRAKKIVSKYIDAEWKFNTAR